MKGDLERSDIELFKNSENIQINEETKKYFENKNLLDISMIREESVDSILKKNKETEKLDLKDDEISEKSENQEILINDHSMMDAYVEDIKGADKELDRQRAEKEKGILYKEFFDSYINDLKNKIALYQRRTKDTKKDSVQYQRLIDSLANVRTILNSDPEPKTTYAKIPLTMFAIHSNEVDILKMLIEDYNFDPNETIMNVTPLELAIATKKYDSIRYLLSIGVSPSEEALKLLEKRKYKKVKEIFDEYINTKEN